MGEGLDVSNSRRDEKTREEHAASDDRRYRVGFPQIDALPVDRQVAAHRGPAGIRS